jgi:hypothetical protein
VHERPQIFSHIVIEWLNAVDAVIAEKFGPSGIYQDKLLFVPIYKGDFGDRYLREAAVYPSDVIECARDICTTHMKRTAASLLIRVTPTASAICRSLARAADGHICCYPLTVTLLALSCIT